MSISPGRDRHPGRKARDDDASNYFSQLAFWLISQEKSAVS